MCRRMVPKPSTRYSKGLEMDARDFSLRLKKIKAEVLAMKQSHKYGLNRTNFDFRFINEPMSKRSIDFRLTLVLETRSLNEPYIDFSAQHIWFYGRSWNQNNKTLIIAGHYYAPNPSTTGYYTEFGIISTKPIESISWEELNE